MDKTTIIAIVAAYVVVMNLVGFFLMGYDKRLAKKKGARRIPEGTLFAVAIAGGSIGSIVGMHAFRHKTEQGSFRAGMPAILIVQLTAVALVVYNSSLSK